MEAARLVSDTVDRPRHIQILDEAARIFNQGGVSSKPLSDVAERLNLSRAALYYYVKDRDDLVFQVYCRTCDLLDQCLTRAQSTTSGALAVVQAFVALTLDPDAPDLSALGELGLLRPEDRKAVLHRFEHIVGRLAGVLADGQARGELRPCDPSIAAQTLVSIVTSIPTTSAWTISAQGPALGDRRLQIAMAQDMLADGWLGDRSLVIDPPSLNLEPVALKKVAAFDRKGMVEARREAILVAASRLFNRKGVGSTSLDEIAATVGATKRTLYQLVGDKTALTMACARRSGQIFSFTFRESLKAIDLDRPTPDVLIQWQRAAAMTQLRRDIEPVCVLGGIKGLDEASADEILGLILQDNHRRLDIISNLLQSGQMRNCGPLSLIGLPGLLWNSMSWLSRGFIEVDDDRRLRVVAEVVEVLSLGLRAL
ncbi:MAG: hypothetical protein CGW95_12700 [Phenylobacterium zucineum]|nr:MAG: hypothetical protein CGW95_12700 [Phenylobacterium zucineum]